jgi:hypothetical protein
MKSKFVKLDFSLKDDLIFQIYENTKLGFTNFYFDFNEYSLDLPFSKFFELFRKYFFGMIEKKIINSIRFENFSKELFDNFVLKYELKNRFYNNFSYSCLNCNFSKYVERFGDEEFKVRENIDYAKYKDKIDSFSSKKLIKTGENLINLVSSLDTKVRFVFVDSFGKKKAESSSERFVCYIYNNPDIFNKIYRFCKDNFECSNIKKYLKLSQQIVLSFAVMKNSKIRNTIYFNVNQFSKVDKISCFDDLGIQVDSNREVWGVGIDFISDEIKYKVYYEKLKVSKLEIIEFVSEFSYFGLKKYLDCFLEDKLNGVLFDYKYDNLGNIISKRIDISVMSNDNSLNSILDIENKNLYTISFEFYLDKEFKVNTYYALK